MGGKNNIQQILFHIESTAKKFGVKNISLENYFPSISEYSLLLENHGFKVIYARLKDRPTLLQCKDGLRNWVKAFRTSVLERISTKHHQDFFQQLKKNAKKDLYHNNAWWADYVRLRIIAIK